MATMAVVMVVMVETVVVEKAEVLKLPPLVEVEAKEVKKKPN